LFSQTTEYALRAIVCLAQNPGIAMTTHQVAELTKVPAGYLSKVLQSLGRAQLVRSQRGLGGGFILSQDPDQITILQVVNAVDPLKRIRECPLGLRSHGANLCPLHRELDDAIARIESAFASTTIAQLLAAPTQSTPLCEATVSATDV